MHTGLSEIIWHNEQSSPLLGAYIYIYIYIYQATYTMTYPLLSWITKFTLSDFTAQSL